MRIKVTKDLDSLGLLFPDADQGAVSEVEQLGGKLVPIKRVHFTLRSDLTVSFLKIFALKQLIFFQFPDYITPL